MTSIQTNIIIVIALVALSAFFSGAETALFSLSKLRLKYLVRKNVKGAAAVEKLKENPHRLLVTILVGNNLVNIAASVIATSIAYEISLSHAVGITTGVMTLLLLVLGEITPKSFATRYNEQIAIAIAKPIQAMQIVLFPIISAFDGISMLMNTFLGKKESPSVTEEEIKAFVAIGQEEGEISESERDMINKVFRFNDIEAKDVMTPRRKVHYVDLRMTVRNAEAIVARTGRSRMPVCRRNADHIVGFVYIKDLQKAIKQNPNMSVDKIMRKIPFVPAAKKIDTLLKFFQRNSQHLAIVVNDSGENVGLVTLEDVLEEIVGEIIDETEKVNPRVRQISQNSFIVDGRADLDEINEKCRAGFPKEKSPATISSYILQNLGRMPHAGEVLHFQKCDAKIEKVEKSSIISVVITCRK